MSFVQYVIQHQHGATGDLIFRKPLPFEVTAAERTPITGHMHVVSSKREAKQGQQLARKNDGAAHHAQDKWIAFGQEFCDLSGYSLNGIRHLNR
jgi:hypothetical protein